MSNFYDLPKDILVKMLITIQEETRKEGIYYVISVYYKHGEYAIQSFDEESLRTYLYEFIKNNYERIDLLVNGYGYDLNIKNLECVLDRPHVNVSLKDLIELSKKIGEFVLDNQFGSGVVEVIKGQTI